MCVCSFVRACTCIILIHTESVYVCIAYATGRAEGENFIEFIHANNVRAWVDDYWKKKRKMAK